MSCQVREFCKNNGDKCWLCKADDNGDILYYQKTSQRAPDHPIVAAVKQEKKLKQDFDKREKRDKRLQDKLSGVIDEQKERLKIAVKREENTNKTLSKLAAKQFANKSIRSSDGNSGRVTNNDDHVVLGGEIMYDTKSYSKKVHPPIDLDEYDECRAKAMRHKANCYGQVVYNKDGRAFMVMDLELDWIYVQQKLNLTMLEGGTNED
jgi:hypothetical protein